ncbi:hypothetical protein D3C86_345440 [compost metagenome]
MREFGVSDNSSALVPLTVPTAVQLVPPSSVYHHVPLVPTAAVSAMPLSAPGSMSVRPAVYAETVVPTAPTGAGASSTPV